MLNSDNSSSVAIFTLFYFAITLCFIFKTKEFVSAGLTVENFFEKLLGNEFDNFVRYNIRRTSITLVLHSFLPFGYIIGLSATSGFDSSKFPQSVQIWWGSFSVFSVLFPLMVVLAVVYWSLNGWSNHPIAKALGGFCDGNNTWLSLAGDINNEYKRVEKIVLRVSSLNRVIATDNWIMKTTPYSLNIAHQSDSALILTSADTHQMSPGARGEVQFVNIEVRTTRPHIKSFYLRCNALDFQDLQDKVHRPITILAGVKFHKTTIDHFLEVFREAVAQNPPYNPSPQMELEACIGCMIVQSGVKLVKNCRGEESSCTNCYCRPMWCIDCMARWFASRQDQDRPDTWLSSNCTCPMCRSIFCIIDVCPLKQPV